jgi:hypothetical protein
MYPNRIGSEPTGSKVAEINALIKTAGNPMDGKPNHPKKCWSA